MPTTLKRNVVISGAISVATPQVYDEWADVPKGLRATGKWQCLGMGIKEKEKKRPRAHFDTGDTRKGHERIGLYDETQTYTFTEPKRSKWILINRFVRRNEFFGLRSVGEERPRRFDSSYLHGTVGNLVYSSFDYRKAHDGISTRIYREKKLVLADAIYVLAHEWTDWFVIDIDNHKPTKASTKAHLLLIRHLVRLMPRIAQRLGGGSVFYDYSQDSPKGIHIWVTLKRKMAVEALHHRVRALLHEFADPELDCLLHKNHLKKMGSIEILPTTGQLIRIFGTYDRRVFTTKELLPKDQMFDAEALLGHIDSETTNGNPCARYAQLAVAGLGNDACEAPVCVPVPPKILSLASDTPSKNSGYFSHVVDLWFV